jgi:phage gpG-like protein
MTPEQYQSRLKALEKEFKDFFNKYGPSIAATVAIRLFKQNFRNEGFFGEKWKEVKRRENERNFKTITRGKRKGQKAAKGADGKRKILTGRTGDLGRSIEVKEAGDGRAVIWANPNAFTSKAPYGRVHNEGLKAGRGKGFIMPKRQFMGDHPELRKAIAEELERKLKEIFNK